MSTLGMLVFSLALSHSAESGSGHDLNSRRQVGDANLPQESKRESKVPENLEEALAMKLISKEDLVAPKDLSEQIKAEKAPVIWNVGSQKNILGAVKIGELQFESSKKLLAEAERQVSKSTEIVLYCGCCPLEYCEPMMQALALLRELGYTDLKVLNFKEGLKEDWIDLNYPMDPAK